MQILASTTSRFLKFKRGMKREACLTKLVGKLTLEATQPDETQFLLALYNVVKGYEYGGRGKIVVLGEDGKEKCHYEITAPPGRTNAEEEK